MTCLPFPVKESLTRAEAAYLLRVSGRTVNRYIAAGKLKARYRMVGSYPRLWLKRSDLLALMKSSETKLKAQPRPQPRLRKNGTFVAATDNYEIRTTQKTNGAPRQECAAR
jgi:excisionase family DNA binding protein